MKKLVFGLIAVVLLSTLSFGQTKGMDYFMQMDPVKTAQIHNDVVSGINELIAKDPSLSIKDALLKLDIDLSSEDRLAIYDYISKNYDATQNYTKVMSELKSEDAKEIYSNINTAVVNAKDYESLAKSIDVQLSNADKKLNGFDLQVVKLFGATSEASANYWYNEGSPYAKGGGTPRWIRKDGCGIAQASVGWAIGAAFCGGGPLSYAIACGVGGALASVWPD